MSNEHISQYLDYYFKSPARDYAILITGCWGSGKTHFIANYLG